MAPTTDVEWSKSSSDPEEELRRLNAQRQPRQMDYNRLVPLAWIPVICLLRFGLRGQVSIGTRDLVFGGSVMGALAHAGYVMGRDTTM
mmetsp:Transcript_26/g.103  ORF Transcript_26/g.103 Transcript_26/m.103 type:complete len:88 (-) Transcript_26:443-706(-)|eukprot:CAMPEP_0206147788 /NCGR_PEP_ID=MMETSP1473-20131121/34578_1 /ASSEMBLY_ACC=CAM_ASM_001109 /TAXON_ID=1461547 /ORGANISM="Stichococcus sp, Strain RCC1054" /LENGTH=87 /DNA_ID=CAMNT_0053544877 /DNA_START=220 /DNA_END=483 /DNA_ORIENTATION=-